MTNEKKYKTPEERYDEFYKYCKSTSCYDCHLRPLGYEPRMNGNAYCALKWLNSEAEEELLSCPFCGSNDIKVMHATVSGYVATCNDCWAASRAEATKADAIAAWNRRAK